jgi:Uncharacterized protein conserved in bacteria (DUF2272)
VDSRLKRRLGATFFGAFLAVPAMAQTLFVERVSSDVLAVKSPAERVRGTPGDMQVLETACLKQPLEGVRVRIVDIALQEWAYFGFSVADETVERGSPPGGGDGEVERVSSGDAPRAGGAALRAGGAAPSLVVPPGRRSWRNFTWLTEAESARLAGSIAGYWAITGDGSWIISRQNDVWKGSGIGARWRDPWSAAFVSWVMCESGLDNARFDRAINHHTYIDQAIRARDTGSTATAYLADDVGEEPIEPGDLLCTARRPSYDTIEERRLQLGDGVRAHCDIVIKLEAGNDRILAVGGNVRGSVSLKLLPAEFEAGTAPVADGALVGQVGSGRNHVFAHLKLRDGPISGDAFRLSPTLKQLAEQPDMRDRVRVTLDRAVRALSASVF